MGGPHVRLEERGIFGVDVVPIFALHCTTRSVCQHDGHSGSEVKPFVGRGGPWRKGNEGMSSGLTTERSFCGRGRNLSDDRRFRHLIGDINTPTTPYLRPLRY